MLQYNQKQYNPHSGTTKANLKRHWFYAVIFQDNPKYIEKMIEIAESQGAQQSYENSTTDMNKSDDEIINGSTMDPRYYFDHETNIKYYTFDAVLFDNSPDDNCFWSFNVDNCYDALVIKHGLQSSNVEAYIWLKHPYHKRLFYEFTNPDSETTVIKFYKGKLPPRTVVTIQLRTYVDTPHYSGVMPVNNTPNNTNAVEYHIVDETSKDIGESTVSSLTHDDENMKSEIALMFRAGTLEGLYQILETIDEEYWKSDNDDYVAHTIRDYRKNQDVKVLIYYKNDLEAVVKDLGVCYKIVKTWLDEE